MSKLNEIRCFDYVNRPFKEVRQALHDSPNELFQRATSAANNRADSLSAELHLNIAGIEFGKQIDIEILGEAVGGPVRGEWFGLDLQWQASTTPDLFPVMRGTLAAYPITATETQLDFQGRYEVPLGWMGKAFDALIGHRIAEASVDSFVTEIATQMRQEMSAK